MFNTEKAQGVGPVDIASVFAHLHEQQNAALLEQVAQVDRTAQAIRDLEAITRDIDAPYIGSFLS